MSKRQRQPAPRENCPVCGQSRSRSELVPLEAVRSAVMSEVSKDHPDLPADASICLPCLNRFRTAHLRQLLEDEKGELSALEEDVVRSLEEQESISQNVDAQFDRRLTVGERLSDHLAEFGGSWSFIILFACVMLGWIVMNTVLLFRQPFDPYPFILLNLVLSCLAAIQAPIIMMSQNRQESKDRLRSEYDYRVNLKAELEIRLLHAKVDQLLTHQWQRLLEIQQLQIELMENLAERGIARSPSQTKPTA